MGNRQFIAKNIKIFFTSTVIDLYSQKPIRRY